MATHASTLAWKLLWTEEADRLQSMGLQELDTTSQLKLKPPILIVTNQHIIDFVVLFFWGGWSRKIISKLSSECQAAFRCRCYAQRTIYGDLGSKESLSNEAKIQKRCLDSKEVVAPHKSKKKKALSSQATDPLHHATASQLMGRALKRPVDLSQQSVN